MICEVASPASQERMFRHFKQRLGERFGDGHDAYAVWRALAFALVKEDWTRLRPFARVSRDGRRVFLSRLADGQWCFVLFDCRVGLPITVFREGMSLPRQGKSSIRLGVPRELS